VPGAAHAGAIRNTPCEIGAPSLRFIVPGGVGESGFGLLVSAIGGLHLSVRIVGGRQLPQL
jgi:hypothetical protein